MHAGHPPPICAAPLSTECHLALRASLAWTPVDYRFWLWLGAAAGLILFLYGVLPALQPPEASFGRVYAAYGGIFVVLSLAWGWWIDGVRPDRFDLLGGAIALVGVIVIMYAPRG